ncbi:helix-turn-helix domain-containing protein [Emergencia sp.]|uniref:helix-turn-helix domain-containing protein n=1 Tax=Emergencia sp. TaxID=1926557 RepID=UPI003AF02D27
MMSNYEKYLETQLQDLDFKEEYDNLEAEYQIIKAIIDARLELNLTQQELSAKTGIKQSNLSRIENGNCSPTVHTLSKIARGLDKQLVIKFV